jgi:hypothetical protein
VEAGSGEEGGVRKHFRAKWKLVRRPKTRQTQKCRREKPESKKAAITAAFFISAFENRSRQ